MINTTKEIAWAVFTELPVLSITAPYETKESGNQMLEYMFIHLGMDYGLDPSMFTENIMLIRIIEFQRQYSLINVYIKQIQ